MDYLRYIEKALKYRKSRGLEAKRSRGSGGNKDEK